ncbi:MAG: DNA repair protein RadA, partial [Alphaproteobacteria bacterium]|nr:DNA repair protein RadA [Alphaproteobacteria bacterium]
CRECGTWHGKWNGKCEGCFAWNSLIEEVVAAKPAKVLSNATRLDLVSLEGATELPDRLKTGIQEFDRVCGGGIVPGSVILVGGDPGIGKSTLLLQVGSKLSAHTPCLYVSGEEGVDQIRLRAKRMKVHKSPVLLASTSSVSDIINVLKNEKDIQFVVVDSIQTMATQTLESAPGSVGQIKAASFELIQCAKDNNVVIVLVGHVTKEGALAGPKVLEHMVDTVLYFEGEKHYPYRILRSIKNRFGPTDEIGIFNMVETGLEEVGNPSKLFLNDHDSKHIGMAIYAGLEGSRPILAEIQTLIAPSYLPSPRRTAVGIDPSRLAMILAVLEARCGMSFGNKDVYVNVAGGLKITETACDLAVAAALTSSHVKKALPHDTVYFGEVGLGGEIRRVQQPNLRLKEAEKLGFKAAFLGTDTTTSKLKITPLRHLNELIQECRTS